MSKVSDGLSMTWNGTQWVAKYRTLGLEWSGKRLPAYLIEKKEREAKAWLIDWYRRYLANAGIRPDDSEVTPSKKVSLLDVSSRWIEYRGSDPGTDPVYAKALKGQFKNWIAGHEIARLDIRELGPLPIVTWIRSLKGASSTRLTVASTLSVMLNDCILHGEAWGLDAAMVHPMLSSPHIIKELDGIRSHRLAEKVTPIFDPSEIETIFTAPTSKVWDVRRVKYVLWLFTGCRERELQGLVWSDIKDAPSPHIWISRQLVTGGSTPFIWLADARKQHGPKVNLTTLLQAVCKPPKRNSRRALPLMPLAVAVLKWWRSVGWAQFVGRAPADHDPIFPSGMRNAHQAYGQFCTPNAGAMLLDDLKRLGVEQLYTSPSNGLTAEHTSRSFRHTFASLLSEVGIDDGRIGDLLGHSSGTVTRGHYIEAMLGARIEVVSKLRLPERVVFRAHEISDPSRPASKLGKVISIGR